MASEPIGVVQSLDRALSILGAIAAADHDLGLADVAASVGLPKSTVHRLLRTLELRGFVARSPVSGRYRPGLRAGPDSGSGPQLHEVLVGLADRSGETANLGNRVGAEVVYLDRAQSPQALRWEIGVGARVPVHASAMGKAILSTLSRREVERILPRRLGPRTPNTMVERAALLTDLARVRRRGFAVDNEEFMEAIRCVAVPVAPRAGEAASSALSLVGPAFRLTVERAEDLADMLKAAARKISRLPAFAPREPSLP